jgi:hypothetical protein
LGLCGWCWASLLGCSQGDHPPFVDPDRPDASGDGGARGEGETNGGADGSVVVPPETSEGGGDDVVPDFGDGVFASGEVYAIGYLRDEPGEDSWAITHVAHPQSFYVGFERVGTDGTGAPRFPLRDFTFVSSRMAYLPNPSTGSVPALSFVVDASGSGSLAEPYPEAPSANDPPLETPQCQGAVTALLASPNGRTIYRCRESEWFEGDEQVFAEANVYSMSDDGYVLFGNVAPVNIGKLGTDEQHFVDLANIAAARPVGDGFRAAAFRTDSLYELIEISTEGTWRSLGRIYPPVEDVGREGAFDNDDRLYVLGSKSSFPPFRVTRLTAGGKSELLPEGPVSPLRLLRAP